MDNRIPAFDLQQQRTERREKQRRAFHRNQAIGLLLTAGAVLAWRLLHTPSDWLLPPGWWRLW